MEEWRAVQVHCRQSIFSIQPFFTVHAVPQVLRPVHPGKHGQMLDADADNDADADADAGRL